MDQLGKNDYHRHSTPYSVRFLAAALGVFALMAVGCTQHDGSRKVTRLTDEWRFVLADTTSAFDFAYDMDYDDSEWQTVRVPHDWAIEGDFSENNPSGVGGGALPGGLGWYRRHVEMSIEDMQRRTYLILEGVYMNASVFVNGIKEGRRPYGYSSVCYDISYDLFEGDNVIAVMVDNSDQPNSRWYSGCGIYRNVYLVQTDQIHIEPWGTFVRTPLVNSEKADVDITTTVRNGNYEAVDVDVVTTILDSVGRTVATDTRTVHVEPNNKFDLTQQLRVPHPTLWDVDHPALYTAEQHLMLGGQELDRYDTPFGIRSFYFDSQIGFILNDRKMKINGVCLHHDLGCLGAAVNRRAIERQLQMLKDMGCNAIRCTHNPPSPELLDLCDQMGFIVFDEAFDMWRRPKTANDYSQYFDVWHERDLVDLIQRDRNHPSIVAWSIGNEVLEQWDATETTNEDAQQANIDIAMGRGATSADSAGVKLNSSSLLCRQLADIVHRCDPTRPVTAGCNEPAPTNNLFKANALDIIGFNYHNDFFATVPELFKGKPFVVSESNSALATRGYYKMPSTQVYIEPIDWRHTSSDPSMSCSAYDNCRVPWGSTHERTLIDVRDNNFISGQFVWTGFDYIGEPTPYGWPARSSYFGLIDLAGFPKDAYYLYQSEWQTKQTVLHLFPHWNWRQGQEVDLWCYYNNADEVELFINDQSQGVRHKEPNVLHAMWRVRFAPGVCRVVSRLKGEKVAETSIETAGRPAGLRLTADRSKIHADADDLCFVSVEVVDKNGNLCPTATNHVEFSVEGVAGIEGVDNGSPISLERFKATERDAFYGKCLVVLRSSGHAGNARLIAKADDLSSAEITINCLSEETY